MFFFPWATIFPDAVAGKLVRGELPSGYLLLDIILFVAILLLSYVYAWGKGVFEWD